MLDFISDYLNSGQLNHIIQTEQDYCDILLSVDDDELWYNEWWRCKLNFEWFCRHWLWIENKEKKFQRLIFNKVQKRYNEEKTDFDIIVKARKEGISTDIGAEFFHANCFMEFTKTNVVAHDFDSTLWLYEIVRRYYDNLPLKLKPIERYNTRKELIFEKTPFGKPLNTVYAVMTAGAKEVGRGRDIDQLHLSEFAYYPNPQKIFAGTMQALRKGAKVRIESTANGFNDFYLLWNSAIKGENQYKPHFFAWFEDESNVKELDEFEKLKLNIEEKRLKKFYNLSDEQINWYLHKLNEPGMRRLIKQEHPSNPEEAFLQSGNCIFDLEKLSGWFIESEGIKPIHKRLNGMLQIWKRPDKDKEYVIGADTAEHESEVSNDSAISIRDKETWEQVAILHMPGYFKSGIVRHEDGKQEFSKEKLFAKYCERLGYIYNEAKIAIENNRGRTHLSYLNDWCYPNLYKHKDFDDKGKKRRQLGFNTNAKTKRLLIDGGNEAINENLINMIYPEMISQYMSFIKHENGEFGAQKGKKDDIVLADLICIYVLKYTSSVLNIREI